MESLWTDQYRPKSLRELDYHNEIGDMLTKLAINQDFPHLLFYGPNGAGKKTRIMAFLREVYGTGVYSVQSEEKEFKISDQSNTTTSCNVLQSKFHIDVTPSDADNHDKVIIQKLIKEVASTHQLNTKAMKEFKVVVINEVDNLSKEAQASLRRTMEKYIEKCRLILCCESLAKIIHPIRSRCLLIRISAPKNEQLISVLQQIAKYEKFQLPEQFAQQIALASNGNLREAILHLQCTKLSAYPFNDNTKVHAQEWKTHIQTNIVDKLVNQQSTERLKEVRETFYQLLVNCIPGERIIIEMLNDLLRKTNSTKHYQLIQAAAITENKMKQGSKSIFHLEALAARIMVILK